MLLGAYMDQPAGEKVPGIDITSAKPVKYADPEKATVTVHPQAQRADSCTWAWEDGVESPRVLGTRHPRHTHLGKAAILFHSGGRGQLESGISGCHSMCR